MDQLLNFLTTIWNRHWVIIVIGLGVGLLAFIVGRLMLQPARPESGEGQGDGGLDSFEPQATRDRRSEARRPGNPVEVELTDPSGRMERTIGWVCDRSRGGLGLRVHTDIPIGTVLNAKPRVRDNSYSVQIEVRSSRPEKDGFFLGCQFLQMPPWNVLLLFG